MKLAQSIHAWHSAGPTRHMIHKRMVGISHLSKLALSYIVNYQIQHFEIDGQNKNQLTTSNHCLRSDNWKYQINLTDVKNQIKLVIAPPWKKRVHWTSNLYKIFSCNIKSFNQHKWKWKVNMGVVWFEIIEFNWMKNDKQHASITWHVKTQCNLPW